MYICFLTAYVKTETCRVLVPFWIFTFKAQGRKDNTVRQLSHCLSIMLKWVERERERERERVFHCLSMLKWVEREREGLYKYYELLVWPKNQHVVCCMYEKCCSTDSLTMYYWGLWPFASRVMEERWVIIGFFGTLNHKVLPCLCNRMFASKNWLQ